MEKHDLSFHILDYWTFRLRPKEDKVEEPPLASPTPVVEVRALSTGDHCGKILGRLSDRGEDKKRAAGALAKFQALGPCVGSASEIASSLGFLLDMFGFHSICNLSAEHDEIRNFIVWRSL